MRCQEEQEGSGAATAGGTVPRLRRSGVGLSLQCTHLRGLQGILSPECDQKCGLLLQVWTCLRNGHVHATQVPGVSTEEMPGRGHATRMRCARESVCDEAAREEGAKGEGQGDQFA